MASPVPHQESSPAPNSGSLQLRPGQLAAILGCFSAAFAIWVLPYFLGPLAMILGGVAIYRGERRGRWVILAGVVGLGLGIIVHAIPDKIIGN